MRALWAIANDTGTHHWTTHHPQRPTRTTEKQPTDTSPATLELEIRPDPPLGITHHHLRLSRTAYRALVTNGTLTWAEADALRDYFSTNQNTDPRYKPKPYLHPHPTRV